MTKQTPPLQSGSNTDAQLVEPRELDRLGQAVITLPRVAKRALVIAVDVALCFGSVLVSFYLRLGQWPTAAFDVWTPLIAAIAIGIPIFIRFGLYRAIFRYAGGAALMTIALAVMLYAIPYSAIFTFYGMPRVPRTLGLIQPIVLLITLAATRVLARVWLGDRYLALRHRAALPKAMIYGAGSAGRQLARAIASSEDMALVGFIDDDPRKRGATINGQRIYSVVEAELVIAQHEVSDVLLAIPSAARRRRLEVIEHFKALGIHMLMLPAISDLARGRFSVSHLREVEIEDLLGREPIAPDPQLMARNIAGKVVLVTGAGGSIGQELCRQILQAKPHTLLLFEQSEFSLYTIHQELGRTRREGETVIIPLIGSVVDRACVAGILAAWKPDTIFHAAAYKHVPLIEHNVLEGVRNNVFGTMVVAEEARRFDVASFILISTDKAVRPTNVMGATKRIAELLLQALDRLDGSTVFSMVRFGNVLGSSGSVVPLFRKQIADGGPITITDFEMTRYFMTIPEAAQLVIQAGAMARGGDVFVLEMGQPVRIAELARNMVLLSGLRVRDTDHPDGDIEIRAVGCRPGEKLYEELLIGENVDASGHPRIMRANEAWVEWPTLQDMLAALDAALQHRDPAAAVAELGRIVHEYQSSSPLADHVHQARQGLPRA